MQGATIQATRLHLLACFLVLEPPSRWRPSGLTSQVSMQLQCEPQVGLFLWIFPPSSTRTISTGRLK